MIRIALNGIVYYGSRTLSNNVLTLHLDRRPDGLIEGEEAVVAVYDESLSAEVPCELYTQRVVESVDGQTVTVGFGVPLTTEEMILDTIADIWEAICDIELQL